MFLLIMNEKGQAGDPADQTVRSEKAPYSKGKRRNIFVDTFCIMGYLIWG